MLYEILAEISAQLNQHFKLRFGMTEDKLFVSNLVNNDSSEPIEKDSVLLSIVNIQEEKTLLNRANPANNAAIALKLMLLFTTTFTGKRYLEGLKFISEIVGFFQQNKYLEIEGNRLAFEIFNVELTQQNTLWTALGAKYNPSIVYKASFVNIDESMQTEPYVPASEFPSDDDDDTGGE